MRRVQRGGEFVCAGCGSAWDAATARFCGRCGTALTAPAPEPRAREPRRPSRYLASVLVAVLASAALVAGAVGSAGLDLRGREPDPAVDLEAADTVPNGRPVSPEVRDALLAPFDPNRLRCEPAGCERWRVELADDHGAQIRMLGDVVAVVDEEAVTAYSPDTGEQLWRAPWAALGGAVVHFRQLWVEVSPAGRQLAVVDGNGGLHRFDPTGTARGGGSGRGDLSNVVYAGEHVLLIATMPPQLPTVDESAEPPPYVEQIVAHDAASGSVLWTRDDATLMTASDDGVVLRVADQVLLVGTRDGEERARIDLDMSAWLYQHGSVFVEADYTASRHRIRADDDLRVLAEFTGLVEVVPVPDHPLLVAVGPAPDDEESAPDEEPAPDGVELPLPGSEPQTLHLIDLDGTVRWRVPTTGVQLCCPAPTVVDDTLLLPMSLAGGRTIALSIATGEPQEAPLEALDLPDDLRAGVWWLNHETAIRSVGERTIIHHPSGTATLLGGGWPVGDSLPFVVSNGATLLGIEPTPAD